MANLTKQEFEAIERFGELKRKAKCLGFYKLEIDSKENWEELGVDTDHMPADFVLTLCLVTENEELDVELASFEEVEAFLKGFQFRQKYSKVWVEKTIEEVCTELDISCVKLVDLNKTPRL